MKSAEILKDFKDRVHEIDPGLIKTAAYQASKAQMAVHDIHARAIACHCECMGMTAENSIAMCNGQTPPYTDNSYLVVMEKWGIVDDSGKPII